VVETEAVALVEETPEEVDVTDTMIDEEETVVAVVASEAAVTEEVVTETEKDVSTVVVSDI